MFHTPRTAAALLFARPEPQAGSNAAKLQALRNSQALRLRERKMIEKQERLSKRASHLQPAG
ncbi:hypothetical protein [Rhizobium sp. SGZ-381]|uniref:hypothetical protein n=1 Tax=Rhizobium sp. SGZ-381 TaxID=3342800 RepID=UPI003671678B